MGQKRSLIHTNSKPTLTCTIDDHAEDPEYADMRQPIIMNTVHLSLFPPHEIAHAHVHTHPITKRSTGGSTQVFGEHEEVECDSAVEGSEMKTRRTRKAVRGGGLFFQRTEGVLHVLQKLSVVRFDLGLAILHRVLYRRRGTILQTLPRRQEA